MIAAFARDFFCIEIVFTCSQCFYVRKLAHFQYMPKEQSYHHRTKKAEGLSTPLVRKPMSLVCLDL